MNGSGWRCRIAGPCSCEAGRGGRRGGERERKGEEEEEEKERGEGRERERERVGEVFVFAFIRLLPARLGGARDGWGGATLLPSFPSLPPLLPGPVLSAVRHCPCSLLPSLSSSPSSRCRLSFIGGWVGGWLG